jgi:O-antigen/teichoic acid export membrane protein
VLSRKSALIYANQVIGAILGSVSLLAIARFMGPHGLGMVGFGLGMVGTFSFIADLGFSAAHVKRVSEGKPLARCMGLFIWIKLVLAIALVVTVVGAMLVWKYILGRGLESVEHEYMVYIMLIYYVTCCCTRLKQNVNSVPE